MEDGVKVNIQLFAGLAFVLFLVRLLRYERPKPTRRTVAILVLGDVGRSPRMMYHAESFATSGFETYVIGYRGSKPVPSLLELSLIRLIYLKPVALGFRSLPFLLLAPIKVVHQITTIFITLFRLPHSPEFIMVQNPPSIPTLAVVWLFTRLRNCKLIIDWHNLGYTILALKLGPAHPLVRVAKRFEATFGRTAYAHLFVTHAMRTHLVQAWDLQGHKAVLHDRPPAHFRRTEPSQVHELFLRLHPLIPAPSALANFLPEYEPPYSTPFTHITRAHPAMPSPPASPFASPPLSPHSPPAELNMPALRPDRPALVVSSTSWTADEDFGILLDALELYEKRARERAAPSPEWEKVEREGEEKEGGLPKVLMVVTGKGPLKEQYMADVRRRQEQWQYVRCVSLWLEAEDYPVLLGSADVGISLHSSSSALDLPMKVVDMFGCGLPVCALDFACLDELVKEGVNGLVFQNAEQLSRQLETLLARFPAPNKTLDTLRDALTDRAGSSWEWSTWAENWDHVVRPLVLSDAK